MSEFSDSIFRIAVFSIPLLLGVTLHELAHGYAALKFGDPTARDAGRLTLNPIKHMDPLGTGVFLMTAFIGSFVIGWAKPVPINPWNFRNIRKGLIVVSAAGALANFFLACCFFGLYALLSMVSVEANSPLRFILEPALTISYAGVLVNSILGVFNLLPIPPLDGSKIMAAILPRSLAQPYMKLERFGLLILIALLWFGVLGHVFGPVLDVVRGLLHSV